MVHSFNTPNESELTMREELTNGGSVRFRLFGAYRFFMKYVAPAAIGIVFLNELGVLDFLFKGTR